MTKIRGNTPKTTHGHNNANLYSASGFPNFSNLVINDSSHRAKEIGYHFDKGQKIFQRVMALRCCGRALFWDVP